MSKKNKVLCKFLQNPQGIKFIVIETILLDLDFCKLYGKGSHVKFRHQKVPYQLIIPVHNKDCKKVYKAYIAQTLKKYIV